MAYVGPQGPGAPPYGQPPTVDNASAAQLEMLHAKVQRSGNWFYWIGGLSIANSVISLAHGDFSFFFGLGFTQLLDGIATEAGHGAGIAVAFSVIVSAFYVMFGYFACRHAKWAFITGILLYSFDLLLCLLVQYWPGVAVHVIALFMIGGGLKAVFEASALEERMARDRYFSQTPPPPAPDQNPYQQPPVS